MEPTIYYIILRTFSTILAIVAIILQFYVLLDLESITNEVLTSSNALAISIYISMILCVISFNTTVRAWEKYNDRK